MKNGNFEIYSYFIPILILIFILMQQHELEVKDTEHSITEVAVIETVFSSLKEYRCFSSRLKLFIK